MYASEVLWLIFLQPLLYTLHPTGHRWILEVARCQHALSCPRSLHLKVEDGKPGTRVTCYQVLDLLVEF